MLKHFKKVVENNCELDEKMIKEDDSGVEVLRGDMSNDLIPHNLKKEEIERKISIRQLTKKDLNEIYLINKQFDKEKHWNKQEEILNNKDNVSYARLVNEKIIEYIVAIEKNQIIKIENFIFKYPSTFAELLEVFFYKSNNHIYEMFICDKGLKIFLKIMHRYFPSQFILLSREYLTKYGEQLNKICFGLCEL